ncbi:hypothetical protein BDY17DRAFT_282975 [Neohortaea acidophila]|uniref:Uncharacterized protein n=1 Tax=Neohortaea acidophila TaxID=245834 RepID=A0A6A6PR42_9PEZI|nr:uncharacterized protein BDY17DRAFT_282975 [Neohortaea acidophila]KAF2482114.1 hypothetical protein BDY17DRAFT_282975 [Neohortaea acidophila]
MPFGTLTPLGRQLRSVVAAIGHSRTHASQATSPRAFPLTDQCRRAYHVSYSNRASTATAANEIGEESETELQHLVSREEPRADRGFQEDVTVLRSGRKRRRSRRRVDHITQALRRTGKTDNAPAPVAGKQDLSYSNVARQGWLEAAVSRTELSQHKHDWNTAEAEDGRLAKVLANWIQHHAAFEGTGEAEWMIEDTFALRAESGVLLRTKGYSMDDLKAWSDIVTSQDSLQAARALVAYITTRGPQSLPLFVLLYALRRPYISARALEIILQRALIILTDRRTRGRMMSVPENAVFLIFMRLLRHAREVWPRALARIAQLLVDFLPAAISKGEDPTIVQMERLTYMLNQALRLIAKPTALEPFKNNHLQEAAIVCILRFMAEHRPTLQTSRDGYRAVVLVQLAQRKTPEERQWAELKALSWPPWKQERTAMDSDITADVHGTSKARETLMRMQEAGYPHRTWEKTAMIYTGWDVDSTPTIQTLTLLSGRFVGSESSLWTARITTTRTAQEAWACYLAYDDANLPPDQDVFLAIFRKLHNDEMRRKGNGVSRAPDEELHPGDGREVEPLPPSTHLHTYTRTPPPTMDGLYRQLRNRGIVFKERCLAFLIANASSLELGQEYLQDGAIEDPELLTLLESTPPSPGSQPISAPLLAAYVELLSRFSMSALRPAPAKKPHMAPESTSPSMDSYPVTRNLAVVQAIELMVQHRLVSGQAWASVLSALARVGSMRNTKSTLASRLSRHYGARTEQQMQIETAILAYRLVRRVLSLMQDCHLDLDAHAFHALCRVTENMANAGLTALTSEAQAGTMLRRQALELLRSTTHTHRLRGEFSILVGTPSLRPGASKTSSAPASGVGESDAASQLLEVPGPSILHAYVRALGWMGDFDGLLDLARWIVEHQEVVCQERDADRNGRAVFRRMLVALRVFLERSWIAGEEREGAARGLRGSDEMASLPAQERELRRRRMPAPRDVVEEIRGLVESVEDWGGWAEDEEVEAYVSHAWFRPLKQVV